MSAQELLLTLLSKCPVVIFSAPACGKCVEIATWLSENCDPTSWVKYDVPSLADDYEEVVVHELVALLKETTGRTAYPFCFYQGKHVSDTNELTHIVSRNHLDLKFDEL
jgi:hypothetical protein